ncbi:HemK2/MTQ2 family protein methyltransferase [Streptomyces sp. NBC_01363]|uniref:HemK2/MTQ2 family protein methyltransferase n=1 Tax=Streptomyces sp. NBC_01363 TaxID=2903840 RepID=UPI002251D0BA|nr:HemK2/MTQ2 family protein methyltransferase [Streptomyces sp. NBC_01363]MCX4734232.1 methyltransferase [Streptomyces sp. NBC_01363]
MKLLQPPGVYMPQEDTAMLISALWCEHLSPGAEVLDVGTGTGAVAIAAARHGAAHVIAIDTSAAAVLTTRLNALLSGHARAIRASRGDLTEPATGLRFDLVLANPPYVPSANVRVPRRGIARAWEAGIDGRAVLDRLCAKGPALLRPGGVLLAVHSVLSNPAMTLARLAEAGLDVAVTDRRFVPFGPVLRERAGWLETQGLIERGQEAEELVVIRAERPY